MELNTEVMLDENIFGVVIVDVLGEIEELRKSPEIEDDCKNTNEVLVTLKTMDELDSCSECCRDIIVALKFTTLESGCGAKLGVTEDCVDVDSVLEMLERG